MSFVEDKTEEIEDYINILAKKYGPDFDDEATKLWSMSLEIARAVCYEDFRELLDELQANANRVLKKHGLEMDLSRLVDINAFEKKCNYTFTSED